MRRLLLAALVFALLAGCSSTPERPYVVLVSLDGFRSDYAALHGAPNLDRLARQGVRAEALIPSYPTETFPNHTAIATGMYPEHNGIVGNIFYDPRRNQTFHYNQKDTGGDGSWYGGTPLWVLAEKGGLHSSAYFWPATDTEIQGTRPSAYFPYDGSVPNEKRVDQVLAWLRESGDQRPHFITLYFSDVDSAGHSYGPEAPETRQAVAAVDAQIGRLMDGMAQLELPAYLFVISDHGMTNVTESVSIGRAADFAGFTVAPEAGSQIMLYSDDQDLASTTITRLNDRHDPRYHAYRRELTPGYLYYDEGYRIGDVVVMATAPVSLRIDTAGAAPPELKPGAHGYDPFQFPQMDGIFYAQGPGIKPGQTIFPFQNVHIYPLIAHILGLEMPLGVDGSLDVLQGILNEQGAPAPTE